MCNFRLRRTEKWLAIPNTTHVKTNSTTENNKSTNSDSLEWLRFFQLFLVFLSLFHHWKTQQIFFNEYYFHCEYECEYITGLSMFFFFCFRSTELFSFFCRCFSIMFPSHTSIHTYNDNSFHFVHSVSETFRLKSTTHENHLLVNRRRYHSWFWKFCWVHFFHSSLVEGFAFFQILFRKLK